MGAKMTSFTRVVRPVGVGLSVGLSVSVAVDSWVGVPIVGVSSRGGEV